MEHIEPAEGLTQVSSRVAQSIKDSGVTVVWLCEKTGIPRSTMNRRLLYPADFTLNELDRIARALRLDVGELLASKAVA